MTVEARLTCGGVCRTIPLTQYDQGQMIHLNGIALPASYLAEFSNSESGTAEQITQTTDTVTVPDKYLTSGSPVYVWVVVVGEDERTTRYEIIVPVRGRGEPDDYTPTPEEQTAIEAAITALNSAVEAAGVAIEHYPQIVGGIWQVWDISSGEWISTGVSAVGEDGVSPTVSVSTITGGHRVTITDANGDHVFDVLDGEPGQDGTSPTIVVSSITGGHRLTITDAQGTQTVDVMDGEDGNDGRGIVSVEKTGTSGLTDTYTITYTMGEPTTFTVTNGTPGTPGTSAYVWIRYAAAQPTQDSDMKTTPDAWMGIYSGDSATAPTAYTAYTWYKIKGETGPVTDVQVNGTSVVTGGVANVPIASTQKVGAVQIFEAYGIKMHAQNPYIMTNKADSATIKGGANNYCPVVPSNQHESVFYALAKAAGADMASSSNAVGNYTESAKSAISQMLDAPETVSGSTPSITAKAGVRYICGECATLTIVAPASGCIDVTFTSGSTATVLTVSSAKTGVSAIKWANGFDPTSLDANTVYEINILDGEYGVVGSWT